MWQHIKARCGNPNNVDYPRYGGRGITVHPPWRDDFARFLADVLAELGERPSGPPGWTSRKSYYTLDRIDNGGHYEPGNLRWATAEMQANNRRTNRTDLETIEIIKLYEQGLGGDAIAEQLGCGHNTVYRRLCSAGVALRPQSLSLDTSQLRALRAQGLTYAAIADRMGCSIRTVRRRLLD
jgi:DNA-binding CsgD family transcriptional regulator